MRCFRLPSLEETSFSLRGVNMTIQRTPAGVCYLLLPDTPLSDADKLKAVSRSMGLRLDFEDINGVPVSIISPRVYYDLLVHARMSKLIEGKLR